MSIQAKKSLGQNFLRDLKILKKIADFAEVKIGDTVVEVGPGEGGLTEILLQQAEKVIAIEKDSRMVEFLKEKFKLETKEGKLEIIEGDALEIENLLKIAKLETRQNESFGLAENYTLVGNIPYYITGALFKKAFESEYPPKSLTFVVQKEVAERIMARDQKESILSISVKAYGEPKHGGIIKAGSFYPAPKVDSAILSIRGISKERFESAELEENKFFEILKAGFAHKRKLLLKNLEEVFTDKEKLKEIFMKCKLSEKVRAEDLKTEDWFCIAKEIVTK